MIRTHWYTGSVKLAAAFLVVLIASLAAVDPVLCPDGCTDDAQPTHPGACLSCQNGIVTTELQDPVSAPMRLKSQPELPSFHVTLPPSTGIEHPPRFSA